MVLESRTLIMQVLLPEHAGAAHVALSGKSVWVLTTSWQIFVRAGTSARSAEVGCEMWDKGGAMLLFHTHDSRD